MAKYLLAILLVFGFTALAYSAPVGLTSDATTSELWPDYDAELTMGVIVDVIDKRSIDIDSGEFEMNAFSGRIGVSVLKRWGIYVDAGTTTDMQYDYTIKGEKYQAEFDDTCIWGVGTSVLVFRLDNGLEMGLNASYRRADMELDKVTIGTDSYTRKDLTIVSDGYFEEYQGALEIAWRTDYFTPYIGVKYSEVEVDSIFTVGGAQRDASQKNASENIGAFAGLTITPDLVILPKSEQLSINLEGRFIDEEAFSGSLAYKF